MRVIVWGMPDGSVRVTYPTADRLDGETDDAYLERVRARTAAAIPDLQAASFRFAESLQLPNNRRFRNAWRLIGSPGTVVVDMPAARLLRAKELREEIDARVAKVRAKVAAADEDGLSALAIRALKNRAGTLRLAAASLDTFLASVATPADLATARPPELATDD